MKRRLHATTVSSGPINANESFRLNCNIIVKTKVNSTSYKCEQGQIFLVRSHGSYCGKYGHNFIFALPT